MENPIKKAREREIFQLVYGERSFFDVVESENPDFLVELHRDASIFGVEVTEYYFSKASARADRLDGYVIGLLDGNDYRHKLDRKQLTVTHVDIVRADGSLHAQAVPAVIQRVPTQADCAADIAKRIHRKAGRLQACEQTLSHCNLIIRDNSGVWRLVPQEEFYRVFFVPELRSAIAASPFREIFVVTDLKEGTVYAPLKMIYLLAEAYMFNDALFGGGVADQASTSVDGTELFAAAFASTVASPVLIRSSGPNVEVIFGDSGILIDESGSVTVRMYCDCSVGSGAVAPTLDWEKIVGSQFFDKITEYRNSHTFKTDMCFPVCAGKT